MVRVRKAAKRPYSAPSFQVVDANTAKAKLKAKGASKDANVRQMLTVIDKRPEGNTTTPHSPLRNPER